MPIGVQCPDCQKNLKLKDELAGKKIKCPGCGKLITVAAPDAAIPLRARDDAAKPEAAPNKKRFVLIVGAAVALVAVSFVGIVACVAAVLFWPASESGRIEMVVAPYVDLEVKLVNEFEDQNRTAADHTSRGNLQAARVALQETDTVKYHYNKVRRLTVIAAGTALSDGDLVMLSDASNESIATTLNAMRTKRLPKSGLVMPPLSGPEVKQILTSSKGSLKEGHRIDELDEMKRIPLEKVVKHLRGR